MSTEIENKSVEVFGTKEVSVKEFMGSSDKSLVLLSDYDKAMQNLLELRKKHELRVNELVAIEILSAIELKELNSIRAELREPRYLVQNIEKNNISVFEAYKKNDKSNLKKLIDVNKILEDIASDKIKIEEERKKALRDAELMEEEYRIKHIKKRIDDFESVSYNIIQETTIDDVELSKSMLDALVNTEFDFEEYDILFEQAKARVQSSWDLKLNDIKQREEQRLDNERMKQEIFDVRVNRFKELGFEVDDIDIFRSTELSYTYTKSELMNVDSATFERAIEHIKVSKEEIEQAKRDAEIKKEKDEQFEVRKTRFGEIGFGITQNEHFFFCRDFSSISVSVDSVYNASVTEFEQILSKAKQDVIDAEKQKEADDKKAKFVQRTKVLLDLGFKIDSENHNRLNLNGIWSYENEFKDYSDEQFEDDLVLIKKAKDKYEADAKKKADAENKARVKRLAEDKEWLRQNIELSVVPIQDVSIKNQESIDFISYANLQIGQLKSDLLTQLKDL